jgi:hypothetical protein
MPTASSASLRSETTISFKRARNRFMFPWVKPSYLYTKTNDVLIDILFYPDLQKLCKMQWPESKIADDLDKMIVVQLDNNIRAFCGTQMFSTILTRARHWILLWANWIHFLKILLMLGSIILCVPWAPSRNVRSALPLLLHLLALFVSGTRYGRWRSYFCSFLERAVVSSFRPKYSPQKSATLPWFRFFWCLKFHTRTKQEVKF